MSEDHDQLDPAEALMREVGAQLRQVRLERGEELDDVGQHLRIKPTYLLGIEQGDLSTMPGRTYALGFLRSYADYLGFDGNDLITQIKSTVANLTDRTRLRMRTPLPESRLPKTPILVLSLAAVAGIYVGWSYVNHGSQLVIETVAEVPASLRSLAAGAFGEDGGRGSLPAADAARPPAGAEPGARAARSAAARAAPLPGAGSGADGGGPTGSAGAPLPARSVPAPPRTATVPSTAAPSSPPPPSLAATPDVAGASGPAGGTGPGAPPVPAIAPDAGPQAPTDDLRAYALARPIPRPDTPPAPATSAAPVENPPTAVPLAPADTGPADEDAGAGVAPAASAPDTGPDAPRDQLAALRFNPESGGPVGRIHEPDNADARVILRALESSWIHISSLGGDYLRDRTLERGDVFLVPNRPDLELWTGNAGGLELIVDGAVLAPLGDSGAVVRAVPLEPSSLHARFGQPLLR